MHAEKPKLGEGMRTSERSSNSSKRDPDEHKRFDQNILQQKHNFHDNNDQNPLTLDPFGGGRLIRRPGSHTEISTVIDDKNQKKLNIE